MGVTNLPTGKCDRVEKKGAEVPSGVRRQARPMEEVVRLVSDFLTSKSLLSSERALRAEFQTMLSSDLEAGNISETVAQPHSVYTSEVGC